MKIDREMFEEWLAHPVTEHVLQVIAQRAEDNRQQWLNESWNSGEANQMKLNVFKATATALEDLSKIEYEDVDDEERERNPADGIQGAGQR